MLRWLAEATRWKCLRSVVDQWPFLVVWSANAKLFDTKTCQAELKMGAYNRNSDVERPEKYLSPYILTNSSKCPFKNSYVNICAHDSRVVLYHPLLYARTFLPWRNTLWPCSVEDIFELSHHGKTRMHRRLIDESRVVSRRVFLLTVDVADSELGFGAKLINFPPCVLVLDLSTIWEIGMEIRLSWLRKRNDSGWTSPTRSTRWRSWRTHLLFLKPIYF